MKAFKRRKYSILIPKGEVEELSSIKKFPVFIGATEDPVETDVFSDLTFDICKTTGIIQLRNLVDPNIVYSKFHSEAVGKIWEEHHNLLAQLISKYVDDKNILEIGGSDSRLALNTLNKNNHIKNWIIIEPNLKNKVDHPKISYIEDFFSLQTACDHQYKYDMIVHSHVLEHLENPSLLLYPAACFLKERSYQIFSVPNLYVYLKNKFVNTINFEHTLFLTEYFIDKMLQLYNFKIIEKKYYKEHSIFYVTQKINKKITPRKIKNNYKKYKKLYLDFFNYYINFVKELNDVLKTTNKNVYLFGGHVFSQYLISLGLDTSKIICILDNSQLKKGKRLYGTNLMIKSPNDVTLDENSLIILKVGQYKDEIKTQLMHINKKITFYE